MINNHWRIYIRYFRPNYDIGIDEKFLLDYEIYWFHSSDIPRGYSCNLDFATANFHHWKLLVYRAGNTVCMKRQPNYKLITTWSPPE